jgi:hypothetical protein
MRPNVLFALIVLLIASDARADIIDLGDVTRDTRTDLDWLDLTRTTDLSINDILNNVGGFAAAGWRHANEAEMCELMKSFGMPGSPCPQNAFTSGDLTPFSEFMARFGITDSFGHRTMGLFPPPSQTCPASSPFPTTVVGFLSRTIGVAKVGNICGNDANENYAARGNFLVRPIADSLPDFDGDRVADSFDNCSEIPNPAQDDTDGDDCGNLCDADYNNSGTVGFVDFGIFLQCFQSDNELCQHAEPIGGRAVGFADFGFFMGAFSTNPGPSGTTAGTTACP